MADNAPLDIQPLDEGAPLPQEAVQEAAPEEDSDQPPMDSIELLDEPAVQLPPPPPPVQLTSGPTIQTSAHDPSVLATGIPQQQQEETLFEPTTSAAEVAKLQDPKDEAVTTDASAELKSEAQVLNGTTPDPKDLPCIKSTEGSEICQGDGNQPATQAADNTEAGQETKQGPDQPETEKEQAEAKSVAGHEEVVSMTTPNNKSFYQELSAAEGYESGTEEEQTAFRKDVESFYRENNLEFKAPKFYKEDLNLLKLWRAVIKLGGYEEVTSCKLWRNVGESFRPPKTCTTVSWTFRIFYEKALLEYEKNKLRSGELPFSDGPLPESLKTGSQAGGSQALGSGRARRDAAARAMQGWHSQRLLDNGEVCHPIIKDKNLSSAAKVDNKQFKTNGAGLLKRKKPSGDEHAVNITPIKTMKSDTMVTEIGPPTEWVKINIQKTSECFEIYALVPGFLREEVHVQSDPAGRVIISGQPKQLDNPWGITPFKKVVSLPCRIDPHHTSAVVTLHGQLFVRVPFEQQGH